MEMLGKIFEFIKSMSENLGEILVAYGGPGLFAISFLDSSFVSFPGINDALLIYLSSLHPYRAPLYAVVSALGSVFGAFVMYWLVRSGRRLLSRDEFSVQKLGRARAWLTRNGFLAVLVMSILPPPAPFKLFILSAGVLRFNIFQFVVGLSVGRLLRFGIVAYLGARYGKQAEVYLRENFGWVSLAIIFVVAFCYWAFRRYRSMRSFPQQNG